ncbi:ABC transporter permease [Chitiniphilus shinanonensis]|uniref:ABC transporter permease n=1 Tax=Chitiniphilus shinanonensis TaxID=553088 RepID=UPI00333F3A29
MMGWAQAFRHEAGLVWRSRWDRALVSWLPLAGLALLIWLFSAGATRQLPVVLVDNDHSALSRALMREIAAAPAVRLVAQTDSLDEAWSQVRAGHAFGVVHIPHGAARDAARGSQATVFVFYNNSFYTAGGAVARDVSAAVMNFNATLSPLARPPATADAPSPQAALPMAITATSLFNSRLSYEWGLVPVIYSAVLNLTMLVMVIAAYSRVLGREGAVPWQRLAGVGLFYVMAFSVLHSLGLVAAMGLRGWTVSGSLALMWVAQWLMYAGYAVIGLLFLGLGKGDVVRSLSTASVFAGPALAYSNALFPTLGAPWFTRFWSLLMPYTTYIRLQGQQLYLAAPLQDAWSTLVVLAAFIVVPAWPAWAMYRALARKGPA